MNTNIRLFEFSSANPNPGFKTFLSDFTEQELLDYLIETFSVAVEEVRNRMIPIESTVLMFDIAEDLFNRGTNSVGCFASTILGILERKTRDYNADKIDDPNFRLDGARIDYFPFEHWSYLQMLWTKIHRIRSISTKSESPEFEGISDSLIDLGSYLIFYYSFLDDISFD